MQDEIIPVKGSKPDGSEILVTADEGIRWPADKEKLSKLKLLKEGGRITAALASQISDGASGVLICNENALKKYGLKPRAKIVALSVVGMKKKPATCFANPRR